MFLGFCDDWVNSCWRVSVMGSFAVGVLAPLCTVNALFLYLLHICQSTF